ncbi:hypothetical protein PC123_g25359 [Phytophthora cactorum]|nr:hypothetical protein PC120_g21845 [Phytophthora cactorum]KAG4039085.1 hypothetical protein PC123_g25359 [Phytophthora cactorum]
MLAADVAGTSWRRKTRSRKTLIVTSVILNNEDAWHSDSDECEDNDEDWLERPQQLPEWSFTQRWVAGGDLLPNRPLQSPRLAGTLSKVLLKLQTLAVVGVALYGVSCSVGSMTATNVLNWRQLELESPVECRERLL